MSCILALDQGTTSSRAILFDERGEIVATAQRALQQIYPKPGWVEHDPMGIWRTQADVAAQVLAESGRAAGDVAAVGLTNQRETTVVWERSSGRPVGNAIVWQDRRTAGMCDRLRADGHEELFRERTGLVIDAYFSGTKLAWILDHVADARSKAERGDLAFGTIDSWLAWNLSGGRWHITDASNASRTLLFNIHDCDWDEELLKLLRIPRSMLPDLRPSLGACGEISNPPALAGICLAGMLGDQQAAMMGQTCFEPGSAKNTYGTGCFLLMNTGDTPRQSAQRLLTTIAWQRDRETIYALEGSVFIAGAIVQWLRDGLGIIERSSDIEPLARQVADSGGIFLVPALVGLGAPHWDPYARGLIIGLTRGTTAAHLARAALEGIAFQVGDLVEAMQADSGMQMPELRVDGGAAANDLLLQFQADILQIPVVRPRVLETTALGAAYAAGLSTGYWSSPEEVASHWEVERRFEPVMSADHARELRSRWQEAVRRSRNWER